MTFEANFKQYAKLYDGFNQQKDYLSEIQFILSLLKKKNIFDKRILELGCGTGSHSILLAKNSYNVDAVDISSEMIQLAKKKTSELLKEEKDRIDFFCEDILTFRSHKKYSAIICLFHVICYLSDLNNLASLFKNVAKMLTEDGIFLFDFWYGPAVLSIKPEVKNREITLENIPYLRVSTPKLLANENTVDVLFEFKKGDNFNEHLFSEVHRMRYYFLPEINYIVKQSGLKIDFISTWGTDLPPSISTWNVIMGVKKI